MAKTAKTEEMKIEKIRWKQSFYTAGIKAEVAYRELERIRAMHGGTMSAQDIVDESKPAKRPLHKYFEWDDAVAASEHRRRQAGALLRSLEIVYVKLPDQPRRGFEVIQKSQPGAAEPTRYGTVEDAMKDERSRDQLIAEAIRQLMAWRRRFHGLHELDHLFQEIEKAEVELAMQPVKA